MIEEVETFPTVCVSSSRLKWFVDSIPSKSRSDCRRTYGRIDLGFGLQVVRHPLYLILRRRPLGSKTSSPDARFRPSTLHRIRCSGPSTTSRSTEIADVTIYLRANRRPSIFIRCRDIDFHASVYYSVYIVFHPFLSSFAET